MKRNLDFNERSRRDFRDRLYDKGFRLPDSRPVIRVDDDECEVASGKILLVTDAFVCCDHDIKACLLSYSEEVSIGQFGPTAFISRFHLMSEQPVP